MFGSAFLFVMKIQYISRLFKRLCKLFFMHVYSTPSTAGIFPLKRITLMSWLSSKDIHLLTLKAGLWGEYDDVCGDWEETCFFLMKHCTSLRDTYGQKNIPCLTPHPIRLISCSAVGNWIRRMSTLKEQWNKLVGDDFLFVLGVLVVFAAHLNSISLLDFQLHEMAKHSAQVLMWHLWCSQPNCCHGSGDYGNVNMQGIKLIEGISYFRDRIF